jgi:hypothetical protein
MPHSSRQIRLPATKSNALIAVVSELRGGERSPEVVPPGALRDGEPFSRIVAIRPPRPAATSWVRTAAAQRPQTRGVERGPRVESIKLAASAA